jgi:tetratricopeptide (TPR) repeat protein
MRSPGIATFAVCAAVVSLCVAAEPAPPAAAADATPERIAGLVQQLGDPTYAVRERAQQELIKLGYEAFDALVDAENSDDPEIAMQSGYLVRLVRIDWTREGDPRPVQQILKDYESQSDDRRLARIKQLAELPAGQGIEWLCRLVRFEKSSVLSKLAALAIFDAPLAASSAERAQRAATIHQALDRARRPAARWVLAYAGADADPAPALKDWSDLTDAERRLLDEHPQETSSQIVMELMRRKITLLERLDRPADVADTLHQMVLVERGDASSLGELVDWLAKRKAWTVIDEVAARFAASFDIDPLLLYTLCEARVAQGNRELADTTAERALKLSGEGALDHLAVVERLQERGLTEWSDRELRFIIAQSPVASPVSVHARILLSDSLHDRLLDLEAGEMLKGLVDAMDADANVQHQVAQLLSPKDKKPNFLRAKMFYYLAAHAGSQNNPTEQRALLNKAVELDHEELDVLIALYRLGEVDPTRRATLQGYIKEVVDDCRAAIDEAPDEPANYNELAWLVANTEGDVDDAVRLSQKSVDIVRATAVTPADFRRVGQFLDTLGHCYFAKKDYATAVKCQSEAARLDPYSRAISRQLVTFRAALAAQTDGAP